MTEQGSLDLLVLHGPVESMDAAYAYVERERPRLVVCGHVHEEHGVQMLGETLVVNATSMGPSFAPTEPPMVVDIDVIHAQHQSSYSSHSHGQGKL